MTDWKTDEQLKKEGEAGRRKITQYTRYFTAVLAVFQALGISIAVESQQINGQAVVLNFGDDTRTRQQSDVATSQSKMTADKTPDTAGPRDDDVWVLHQIIHFFGDAPSRGSRRR